MKAEPYLGGVLRRLVVPMLVVCDPWNAAVEVLNLHGAFGVELRKLLVKVLLDFGADIVGLLWGNEAQAELAANRGGDNGLRTDARERTLDSVDRERGVAHAGHDNCALVI